MKVFVSKLNDHLWLVEILECAHELARDHLVVVFALKIALYIVMIVSK